jgi:hypothetical protein
MTDANPFRNAAQGRDFLARNAREQQQASPEAIARYRASFDPMQTDQNQINRAIMAYETARMSARPKPKFILHIDGNHFHARPSRATLWDVVFVAIATATWLALLTSIYLVFK